MRGGGRGRGEQGSHKRKQSEAAVVGAGSSQELLADLFRLDETEVGRAPVIVLDPDQVHGVVANGGDEGDASANTPRTPSPAHPSRDGGKICQHDGRGRSAFDHPAAPAQPTHKRIPIRGPPRVERGP